MKKPNGFVFKNDKDICLLLLNGNEISETVPIITISDYECVYQNLKTSQIMFVDLVFYDKEGFQVQINLNEFDPEQVVYSICDMFSITLFDENNEYEKPVVNAIVSDDIRSIVSYVLSRKESEEVE